MNTTTTMKAGDTVGITPAYQMATRRSDRRDEWTGLFGTILSLHGTDALVSVGRDEVFITLRRLILVEEGMDEAELRCRMNPDRDW